MTYLQNWNGDAQSWQRRLLWLMVLQFVIVMLLVSLRGQQSQETINAVTDQRVATLAVRVSSLEEEVKRNNADARLRVLENSVSNLTWVGLSIGVMVAGQLVTALFQLRNGKKEHE